jgi:hypothetical protein
LDAHRLDALTRSLTDRLSRRLALRGVFATTLASAGLLPGNLRSVHAQAPSPTPLPVCTDPSRPGVGCPCTTGTQDPCSDTTLLCCAAANAAPGASGICTPASVGCNPTGNPTTCTGHGCRCDGGTENACDSGLICCPDNPGVDGGPGHCARESHCNQVGCTSEGCVCQSGTRDGCDTGLVCCAHDPSMAGGPGRCESETVCFKQQCQATTNPVPAVARRDRSKSAAPATVVPTATAGRRVAKESAAFAVAVSTVIVRRGWCAARAR